MNIMHKLGLYINKNINTSFFDELGLMSIKNSLVCMKIYFRLYVFVVWFLMILFCSELVLKIFPLN